MDTQDRGMQIKFTHLLFSFILFIITLFNLGYSQAILDSSYVTPTTVNVSPSGATVTVDLWLRNSPDSLWWVFMYIGHPDSAQATGFGELIQGTKLNGKWRASLYLLASTPIGTYPVYTQTFDQSFDETTINTGKTVQVTGGDSEPPALAGEVTISPTSLDVSTGPKYDTVLVPLQDNYSGVAYVNVKFIKGINQTMASNFALRISGDSLNGIWQSAVEIPQKANGELRVVVDAMDYAWNSGDLNTGKTLIVTGGDTSAPVFVPPASITPTTVNVSSGDQDVTVTATMQDWYIGVKNVYFDFVDSALNYIAGSSAALISGDSLNGQWRAVVTIPQETEAGTLKLEISSSDKANNNFDTLTSQTLQVTRVPEALVTFQVDLRRLERLGLFSRTGGFDAIVEIFDGVNAGSYNLDDPNDDSIWTYQKALVPGQTITYAFAIVYSSHNVYELGGSSGGRTLNIPSADPIVLPVVTFDNLPIEPVDQNFAARVVNSFNAGNPYLYGFNVDTTETFITIDFSTLDRTSLVAVRRFAKPPGGTLPSGISTMASNIYWAIDKAPADVNFSAQIIFDYNLFGGITNPGSLRLLRRENSSQLWTVVTTVVNLDNQTLSAIVDNNFSEWTIGSTSSANTLQEEAPGMVSNPNPSNGATQVIPNAEFTWSPASAARRYDFYLWKSTDPMPSTPTIKDLKEPRYQSYSLLYNTTYNWKVVAKNIVGTTSGPTWSFSTQSVADLIVANVDIPPSGYSGKQFDVKWTVSNIGNSVTNPARWSDYVFLSIDTLLDTREDTRLGIYENMNLLNPNESYINSGLVTLPDGIFGEYYIIISTDMYNSVSEIDDSNNISYKILSVILTPPPDLQVILIQAPDMAFSGQKIDLSYTVKNTGTNSTQTARWYDAIYISQDSIFNQQNSKHLATVLRTEVLLPDSIYSQTLETTLPDGIDGTYYLFVYTDYTNYVYEYTLETNNLRMVEIEITLAPPPDLVVTSVSGPTTGNSGSKILINWTAQNQGLGTASGNWKDRIFISTVTPFDSNQAIFIKEFSHYGDLEIDSIYNDNQEVTLPNGISGDYYIYVEADWKNQIFEHNFEDNNILGSSTTTAISLSPWPDLFVTSIQKPDSTTASDMITITYQVTNQGSGGITAGQWRDSIYISSSSAWDPANAIGLGTFVHSGNLAPSGSITKDLLVRIPRILSEGTYYVYVKTDLQNTIYEHTDESNNISRSGSIFIHTYPPVDLSVISLTSSDSGYSGQPFNFLYTVQNIGSGNTPVSNWTDVVYLSSDTTFISYEDIFLTRILRLEPLLPGASYTRNLTTNIPNGISGDYYIIVKCDSANDVEDVNLINNTRYTISRTRVTLSPSPDLQFTALTVPSTGQAGQPVKVSWSIKNNGSASIQSGEWYDAIYLSQNSVLDFSDIGLGNISKNSPLGIEATYDDSLEVTLPISVSGSYYIIVKTDSRNEIYEHGAENNNIQASLISITLPPPADLIVTNIFTPATAIAGKYVTIRWTIRNQGTNTASGRMSEAVYFSSDTTWGIDDPLLGIVVRDINLAPGALSQASLKANIGKLVLADSLGEIAGDIPGLLIGDYYVIVRTNFKNNIRETDLTNNKKASSSIVNVNVLSLPLSVLVSDTIYQHDQNYYRVNVPANMDLRLTATGQSNVPTIDMYIAYGRIPTTSDYEYRTLDPIPISREVFIPTTQAGNYFITVRSNNYFSEEVYTIIAETLSFSLSSIYPNKGGMGGNVTTTARGAGFRDSTRVFLYKSGNMITEGTVRKLNSSMEMIVRWNLENIPLGTYDVVARNLDGSTITLSDGFQVEPAREMIVSIGQSTPNLLLVGRRESYTFRFTNTSNVDIPYTYALFAVPLGTEVQVSASSRFYGRGSIIPDSLKQAEGKYDDFVDAENARFIPLLVRDLIPSEAVDCRITFRNPLFPAGSNFPMSVGVRTFAKDAYLTLQLSMIESFRQQVLQNQSSFSPEVVARAYDAQSFAQFMLDGYVSLGLMDQSDLPASFAASSFSGNTSFSTLLSYSTPSNKSNQNCFTLTNSSCDDFFSKLGCVAAVIDCFIPFPPIPPPFNFIMCGFGIAASCGPWDAGLAGCIGVASGLTCLAKELICKRLVGSLDPNDIVGPEGYGDRRWVAVSQTLPYQIRFENDPQKATAPAQRVSITQQLDSTIDLRTFRLSSFGFANLTFEIPGNPSYYSTRLNIRDSLGIYVDVTAGINITNGQVFWNFKSIDSATGELPSNPLVGLLPINDSTGRGNGFVRYTVRPKQTSQTGDSINAKARIVFDQNYPLDTPPVQNTIDAVSPSSNVRPLPPTTTYTSFPVSWGGVDDSSGSMLKSYSIYVSRNDSPYVAWLVNTTDTMVIYTGAANGLYKFFSLATDNAGNTEATKLGADASIQIITSVDDKPAEIPKEFALYQNYPNPFNPTTTIRYDLPMIARVVMKVYNVLGQEVVVLIDEEKTAGKHQVQFNSTNLASGVYFYRIQANKYIDTKKFLLLK